MDRQLWKVTPYITPHYITLIFMHTLSCILWRRKR